MNKAIDTFFMGIFFMVSGYLGHRAFAEKVSLRKFFEVKTYNLLIPLFVVGTVYVLCHDLATNGRMTVNPLLKMITNGDQMGYWFLLTLFVFRIMALVTGAITNGEVLKRHQVIHCAVQLPVYLGGDCPKTIDHKSEILQSVSSSDDSCLSYGNNYQLLGGNTSNPSSATYNLKVENSQN